MPTGSSMWALFFPHVVAIIPVKPFPCVGRWACVAVAVAVGRCLFTRGCVPVLCSLFVFVCPPAARWNNIQYPRESVRALAVPRQVLMPPKDTSHGALLERDGSFFFFFFYQAVIQQHNLRVISHYFSRVMSQVSGPCHMMFIFITGSCTWGNMPTLLMEDLDE